MKIGYLLNTYPVTSATFIRREIEALEARGVEIKRFSVRRWEQDLVDPRDIAERDKTEYVLSGNAPQVIRSFLKELVTNPVGIGRAIAPLRGLMKGTGEVIRPLAYLLEAAHLKQRCAAQEIRHLHCHFGSNAPAVAMLTRVLGGPSYSFTAHGPDEFVAPEQNRFDLKMRHAAFAIAITHYARMQIIRWAGIEHRDKVHVAHCGLDLTEFVPTDVPANAQELICVGRLCPQKGQTLIPEAIAPLVGEFPDLKVVLIGEGETRPLIESEIKRLGLENNIELTGWMANKEVLERLKKGRALLLPSFAEGLPIVIMESLALGRPAISTYIAGIPELLDRECGWIIPASSVEDLRKAIRDVMMSSPIQLTRLGREGRRRIEEGHTIEQLAEQLHIQFESALTGAT
ncbi:MAG: glycosyltransferase family 4 protein [Pseudomonadota bacterium]